MNFLRSIVNAVTPNTTEAEGTPSPPSMPYNPSPSDTVLVRSYLVYLKLPTELALTIIDYAQYYPIVRGYSDVEQRVSASFFKENSAAVLCVVSEPIPPIQDGERIKRKTVQFRLRSHDQGWGGDEGCRGTYNGSYTWFDASILRPLQRPGPSGEARNIPFPANIHPRLTADCLKDCHFSLIAPQTSPNDPAWLIQRNLCASPQERTHVVEWREGDAFNPSPGSGDGQGFCETLQPGDRIGIWARALYPGWANCVKEVSVEVLLEID